MFEAVARKWSKAPKKWNEKRRRSDALNRCLPVVQFELLEPRTLLSVSGASLFGPYTVPGTTWVYTVSDGEGDTATYTRTAVGPTTFDGMPVYELDSTLAQQNDKLYLGIDDAGDIVSYEDDSISNSGDENDDAYSPYQVDFPASMNAGAHYENIDTDTETDVDTDGNSSIGDTTIEDTVLTLASEGLTAINVPYGTVKAYEVTAAETDTQTDSLGNVTTTTSGGEEWFSPGIGLVEVAADDGIQYVLTSFTSTSERLSFTQEPDDTDKGATMAPVRVSVLKDTGGVDTDATGTITVSLNSIDDGDGNLTGTVEAPIVDGVATFSDLKVDAGGTYTFTADDDAIPAVTTVNSDEFDIDASGLTWTGAGDGLNWSDPKNWDANVKPVNGDSLIFPAGAPLTSNNDLADLSISSIDIQGSGYTLTGNEISLTSDLTSEAGNNTYGIDTDLVGSPTLDDEAGDLAINADFSGDGLTITGAGTDTFEQADAYTGPTTLGAGATVEIDSSSDALGTGEIDIQTAEGNTGVTIKTLDTLNEILKNTIEVQKNVILNIDPDISFDGSVTFQGDATINPISGSDSLTFTDESALSGAGMITITGNGKVVVNTALPAGINFLINSGELDLNGELKAAVDGAPQVVVKGGNVVLQGGMSGAGGIDLKTGMITSSAALTGYTGAVTLDTSFPLPSTVVLNSAVTPLGTGTVTVVSSPTTDEYNYLKLDASSLTSAVLLGNAFTFQDGTGLGLKGQFTFAGTTTLQGAGTIMSEAATDQIALANELAGAGVLSLAGPGTFSVSGNVDATVGLNTTFGANAVTTSSTRLKLSGDLLGALDGDSQVVANCALTLQSGLNGTGGIDIQGGNATAGSLLSYTGTVKLETSFFSLSEATNPVVTLTSSTFALGTGALMIENSSGLTSSPKVFAPIIDASGVSGGVSLANALTLDVGGQLNVLGTVTLSDILTVNTNASLLAANSGGIVGNVTFNNGLGGTGVLNVYGVNGQVTINGSIAATATINDGGNLTLTGKLQGAAGGSQVTLFGGTLYLISTLTGTGGIDDAGTLQADSTIAYTGMVTLESGGTIIFSSNQPNAIGTGQLIINGQGTLDASSLTQNLNLDNPVVFNAKTTLQLSGLITLTDTVTLSGGGVDLIDPMAEADHVTLKTGVTGTGQLDAFGKGTTTILGDIDDGVVLLSAGPPTGNLNPAILEIGGDLLGAIAGSAQVNVSGGTLRMLPTLSGSGGIDLKAGTLETGGVGDYVGTVTIEQQVPDLFAISADLTGAIVTLTGTTNLFGTGSLDFASPVTHFLTGLTAGTPTIDATGAGGAVTIGNPAQFAGGVTLTLTGPVSLNNITGMVGDNTIATAAGGDDVTLNGTMDGSGALTLDGPGIFELKGTLGASRTVQTADTFTGNINLDATLLGAAGGTQIVASTGIIQLINTTGGSGGISVQGATLVTDETGAATGASNYSGKITLVTGTIKVYDSIDDRALGTGSLVLQDGVLQNSAGDTASIDNAVTVTGDATISSRGQRFKIDNGLSINGGASLDITGSVVDTGALGGSGPITLDGDLFGVTTSNPEFTGNVVVHSGTVQVVQSNGLGSGMLIAALTAQGVLQSPSTIDPIIDNPLDVQSGTFVLNGQFTFPAGVTVSHGSDLDIEGADSQIVVSGPLSGGGSITVGAGNVSLAGDSKAFTGTFAFDGGKVTPTLSAIDAGGIFNGWSFPAGASMVGVGAPSNAGLEGVVPTFTYYPGSTATGSGSTTAPSSAGTYTVVASFAGSTDYAAVESAPVTFTIVASTVVGQFGNVAGHDVPLTFNDTDGTKVTLSLVGAGTGTLYTSALGYAISIDGSSSASKLTFATSKSKTIGDDGRFSLYDLTIGDPANLAETISIGTITAPTTDLLGDIAISGAATKLTFGNVTGPSIVSIGTLTGVVKVPPAVSLTFGSITDLTINSGIRILALAATNWQDNAAPDLISAPSLGALTIAGDSKHALAGDFAAGLNLTASNGGTVKIPTLSTVNIAGSVGGTLWTVNGAVGAITIKGTVGVDDNAWAVDGFTTATSFTLGDVVDADIAGTGLIGTVKAQRWTAGLLSANAVSALSTTGIPATRLLAAQAGNFGADLTLTGENLKAGAATLGSASFAKGALTAGTWTINGSAGALTAGAINAAWQGTFTGSISSITTTGSVGGMLAALSIKSMKVGGDLTGATLTLNQPAVAGTPALLALGNLTVTGSMTNSTINAAGSLGAISLGRMISSTIFAGVDTAQNPLGILPDAAADFLAARATLASLTINGIKNQPVSFDASLVAAANLGTIKVRDLPTNHSASGGIAGISIKNYTRIAAGKTIVTWPKRGAPSTGTLDTLDAFIARLVV